ncbi:MAG: hypothetical protein HFI20_09900 [Lachnospiraceae bacterium]|nr:hypothetical protein [Lachnospiraceae bacterium]
MAVICGDCDLSCGGTLCLGGILAVMLVNNGTPIWAAFVISGVVSTLAGVLLASRMNTGSSVYGDTTGMLVNCGVVIVGTSFAGGVGGMVESFIGLFVIQLLTNCMNQLGVDSYYQKLCEGILIVIIIASDCFGRKLKQERV